MDTPEDDIDAAVDAFIGQFNDPELESWLREGLATDRAEEKRRCAELLEAAASPHVEERQRAADGLRGCSDAHHRAQAVLMLVRLLKDTDVTVRTKAILTLERFGPGAAAAVHALVQALDDADENVADCAADTLSRLGPSRPSACLR